MLNAYWLSILELVVDWLSTNLEPLSEGVIGVTINYRVGIFGFLNFFDEENGQTEGGNYGLLDQQMAIRFIHENCDFIGCDPDRITIFGESAGGSSVHYQIMSEESSNYLSGAILQSGWFSDRWLATYQNQFENVS